MAGAAAPPVQIHPDPELLPKLGARQRRLFAPPGPTAASLFHVHLRGGTLDGMHRLSHPAARGSAGRLVGRSAGCGDLTDKGAAYYTYCTLTYCTY